jgi:hypothetical protein
MPCMEPAVVGMGSPLVISLTPQGMAHVIHMKDLDRPPLGPLPVGRLSEAQRSSEVFVVLRVAISVSIASSTAASGSGSRWI